MPDPPFLCTVMSNFLFPKNTLRYHEWLLALGIDVDTPHNRTMLVCSQHFKEEDFKTVNKPRKLNPNATPKLKDFPHEIPIKVKKQSIEHQHLKKLDLSR
ncbi:hypothetical protein ABEB36_008735 [Hypothenemus hampei]|uniref:THAP-type domain-containing protein n=1 Tax=Hypothenemus hampei TaxID=57062 RepID=A0ABD1EQ25_HYPHA